MLLVILFIVSKAESKRAISVAVAVVALREYRMDSRLSIAVFNEFKAEFRAVIFASMLSSLPSSASISARTSSRVAGSASTIKAFDDTVATDTINAIMDITKNLDNVLLCISVSPNLMHLQSVDTAYNKLCPYINTQKICV